MRSHMAVGGGICHAGANGTKRGSPPNDGEWALAGPCTWAWGKRSW